jgi:hypothetical protein
MAFYNKIFKLYTLVGYNIDRRANETINQFLKSVPEDSNANLFFTTLTSKRVPGNLKISSLISNSQYFNRINEAIRVVERADSIESDEDFKEKYPTYIPLANGVGFEDGVFSITSGSRTDSITVSTSLDGNTEIKSFLAGDGSVKVKSLEFSPTTFRTDTIVVENYTGIQPTGGSGTGLTVTVRVQDKGAGPYISSVTVTAGGTGYEAGDVVSIATSELGAETSTESTSVELLAKGLSQDQQQRILMTPTGISMPDLPTADPFITGQLYVSDGGIVYVSAGLDNPKKL